jgi:hypothetical protein
MLGAGRASRVLGKRHHGRKYVSRRRYKPHQDTLGKYALSVT